MAWQSGGPSRTSTPEHRARRRRVLARDGHACRIRGPRCIGLATICDHILNLKAGGADTDENCQAACKPCHDAKTRVEAQAGKPSRLRAAEAHPGLIQK